MDQAALQRITLVLSSFAPCWTAWGARAQQSLLPWFVRFALAQRLPNLPTLWVSGAKSGLCCWTISFRSAVTHCRSCRDDDALEAPEQFCSCSHFSFDCLSPNPMHILQRRLVWTAVMSISIATLGYWTVLSALSPPSQRNFDVHPITNRTVTTWPCDLVISDIAAPPLRGGRVKGTSTEAKSKCLSGLHRSWLSCIRLLRITTSCTRTTERILSELILLIHLSVGNDGDCLGVYVCFTLWDGFNSFIFACFWFKSQR